MFPSATQDHFQLRFPITFVPQEIKDKYWKYINRMPSPIEDPGEILNSTIQGVNFPSVSLSPVSHVGRESKEISWRGTELSIPNREMTVTFKYIEGFVNYWMMNDVFYHYNHFKNENEWIDLIRLHTYDFAGNAVVTLTFDEILFTGISDIQFSYADNVQQFSTFECTFNFNRYLVDLELD